MEYPVAIIGLDGATWEIIDPLLARGRLPNLASLMEGGTYGRLATLPGYTSPALWTSIFTGKLPEKHGVHDFYSATSHHLRAKPLYEILLPGGPTGLFQIYAARANAHANSFLVPSRVDQASTAMPRELAFVAELGAEQSPRRYAANAMRCLRHGVPPSLLLEAGGLFLRARANLLGTEAWNTRSVLVGERIRGHIAAELTRRFRPLFLATLFYTLDHLGHHCWHYREPSRWAGFDRDRVGRFGRLLEDAYLQIDRIIGHILGALPRPSCVITVSDHGMEAASTQDGRRPISVKGTTILQMTGLTDAFVTELLPPFRTVFRPRRSGWSKETSERLADFLRSVVFDDGTTPFIIEMPDDHSFVVRAKPEAHARLDSLLSCSCAEAVRLSQVVVEHSNITGTHAPHGILVLSGPGIKQGNCLPEAGLVDVAPTVLALAGHPIGRDMDGCVIEAAIEEAYLKEHPVQYIDSHEDEAVVEEPSGLSEEEEREIRAKLRGLGYLA
jgi:hypothetical protein